MVQPTLAELEVFVRYSVEEQDCDAALALVRRYALNPIATLVLTEFYQNLPEAREEAVVRLTKLAEQRGIMLFVASTSNHHYLMLVADKAHILGEYLEDDLPEDVLAHFGYRDMADFGKKIPSLSVLPEYPSASEEAAKICPACGVAIGELHFLGCPVEICPWCDGQFNKCNCRFEHLQLEEFEDEDQLEVLQDLLDSKGRIPYVIDQKPAYPGSSEGLDRKPRK